MTETAEPTKPTENGSRGDSVRLQAAVIACLVVVIGFSIWLITRQDRAPQHACEGFVRQQLTAPATAKFSNEKTYLDSPRQGQARIDGNVDAQNEYGAMIRETFSCQMHRQGGTWIADTTLVI